MSCSKKENRTKSQKALSQDAFLKLGEQRGFSKVLINKGGSRRRVLSRGGTDNEGGGVVGKKADNKK